MQAATSLSNCGEAVWPPGPCPQILGVQRTWAPEMASSSSLKFDSFWANLVRYQHVGPVERATSDYFSHGGVRTPRNPSVVTTALRLYSTRSGGCLPEVASVRHSRRAWCYLGRLTRNGEPKRRGIKRQMPLPALFVVRAGLALPIRASTGRVANRSPVWHRADYVAVVEFAAVKAADVASCCGPRIASGPRRHRRYDVLGHWRL